MQLKRLITPRTNLSPFKLFQVDDGFIAEEDDKVVFKYKSQHLVTVYVKQELARRRNIKNNLIIEELARFRAEGIL
jgi:hypothetical protein